MMNKEKEFVSALSVMRSTIQYYLEGKLETEIAALLNIGEKEVTYVLSEEGKQTIISHFGMYSWEAIARQREKNIEQLKKSYEKNFICMESEDLRYIVNSVLLNKKELAEYCQLYKVNQMLFFLHLFDLDYLVSKLGKNKGKNVYQQLCTKENVPYQMLYRTIVLYLDSLFTQEEFIQYANLDKYFFSNLKLQIENQMIIDLIMHHKQQIDHIRKTQRPPYGQYWMKDPYLRRIVVENTYCATPKAISDLNVISAYYRDRNIDRIQETKNRRKKEIIKILQSVQQYASLLQPCVLQKIQMNMAVQNNHVSNSHSYSHLCGNNIDYKKEVEQKIEWLKAHIEIGNIMPYYLCGELAIHNFSYEKTALALGIDESQIEMANILYMHFLTTTSQGSLFPFQYSYSILKYASTLYSKEHQKVKVSMNQSGNPSKK